MDAMEIKQVYNLRLLVSGKAYSPTIVLASQRVMQPNQGAAYYAQFSLFWVHEAARWAYVQLTDGVVVVLGNRRRFGELPILEWGRVVCG
jgi:hypothetical protein